ncbi:MAG: diguanylate cyclase [Phycisphaerae bacterium]|nr:diguanylate cyclase [Phycisphaerae bacterium]
MRVLIAEDDRISRRALQAALSKWGYEVLVTSDGNEAWEALQEQDAPKLAVLDWMMPGMDGIEICRRVRRRERDERDYTYIILLTAKCQKDDVIEGMAAGADDYVTKPFDIRELKVRLRAARRVLDLQRKLLTAQEALREQATHDFLTGLWNRQAILGILEHELDRAKREGGSVSVVMGDLDHFKRINDAFGHSSGDAVLFEVGCRLSVSVRPYDAVGRYGGEEFLIVLPNCDLQAATLLAQRLCDEIAAKPFKAGEGEMPVTISLGAATCSEDDGLDVEALIQSADAAMYSAKAAGRNRVVLASCTLEQKLA